MLLVPGGLLTEATAPKGWRGLQSDAARRCTQGCCALQGHQPDEQIYGGGNARSGARATAATSPNLGSKQAFLA